MLSGFGDETAGTSQLSWRRDGVSWPWSARHAALWHRPPEHLRQDLPTRSPNLFTSTLSRCVPCPWKNWHAGIPINLSEMLKLSHLWERVGRPWRARAGLPTAGRAGATRSLFTTT
jgi:hypothetical protein